MKKRILMMLGALFVAVAAVPAVAAVAAVAAVPAASADTGQDHDYRGHFAAFTQTVGVPDQVQPGSLDISSQVGPVLTGRANLAGVSTVLTGTVSSDGQLSLSGVAGLKVLTISVHAVDLAPGDFEPCVLEGSYELTTLLGGRQAGDLVAVHQVPVSEAPSIGGTWIGSPDENPDFTRIAASLAQSDTGVLTGRIQAVLFNPQPDPPGFEFTTVGQAAWDGGRNGYFLVGGADGALATGFLSFVAADTGEIPPGPCRGVLRLHYTDGTVQQFPIQLERS